MDNSERHEFDIFDLCNKIREQLDYIEEHRDKVDGWLKKIRDDFPDALETSGHILEACYDDLSSIAETIKNRNIKNSKEAYELLSTIERKLLVMHITLRPFHVP